MDWDDIRIFAELARRGSLSSTARQLKADHSTIARRMAALEAALGVKLFDRMPRGYVLTEAGQRLLRPVGGAEEAMASIERLAAGQSDRIEGVVRISAPPTLASHWLAPRLAPIRRLHPELVLEIIGDAAVADLFSRSADIAVRMSRPSGDSLISRRVGLLAYGIYASDEYLARTSERDYEFLGYGGALADVPQQRCLDQFAAGRPFAMRTNDLASLISAAQAGLGLAILPRILVEPKMTLVELLRVEEASRELWLVVHPDLRRSGRIRVVLDHLVRIFGTIEE